MTSARVVLAFDEVEDRELGFGSVPELLTVDEFCLQSRKEALTLRDFVAITNRSHRRTHASLFFRLVLHPYQRGSILITTNKGIKDWPEILAGDEVLATAILDRLLHNSYVLDIKDRR